MKKRIGTLIVTMCFVVLGLMGMTVQADAATTQHGLANYMYTTDGAESINISLHKYNRFQSKEDQSYLLKNDNGGYTRLEFSIPSRGLIGYRGEFLTDTKGNGIINTIFQGYGPYKGDIQYRKQGSLIAFESGESVTYGLFNAQERGTLFIGPGEQVYSGMVVGQNPKAEDIELNVCKKKQLTNTRSSGADEALRLTPPRILSLEQALDFIDTDELLEVTPKNLRIRKKILDPTLRKRAAFAAKNS